MADRVRLGFEYESSLTDDRGLLEGEGKQVRYVTVRDIGSIDPECLSVLIAEAAMAANIGTFF